MSSDSGFYHLGLLKEERFDPGRWLTEEVVDWAYHIKREDVPSHVIDSVKFYAIDFLASAIPGVTLEEKGGGLRPVLEFVKQLNGSGPCTVIGTDLRALPQYAALVSGAASGAFELDATHRGALPSHNALPVYAAAFALSEMDAIDFDHFATCIAVACEIETKLSMALNPGIGCVDPCQASALAVAVLAAKMWDLEQQQYSDAMGLAGFQAAGSFEIEGPGYWARRGMYGWLAVQGIHAAMLARAGHIGPDSILEGGYGFLNQFSAKPNISVFDHLGDPWELPRSGVKRWMASRSTNGAIDGVMQICTEHELWPDDIEQITLEAGSYIYSAKTLPEDYKRNPPTPRLGSLSLYWLAAAAVVHRTVWFPQYEPAVFYSPEIKDMIRKVRCIHNSEFDRGFPDQLTTVTTIRTTGGAEHTVRVDYPKGEPENPLTMDELVAKYRDLYRDGGGPRVMSKERHEKILERVMRMEEEQDIGALVKLFSSDTGYQ